MVIITMDVMANRSKDFRFIFSLINCYAYIVSFYYASYALVCQQPFDKTLERELGVHPYLLAESVAQHEDAAWGDGQQLGDALIVLFQYYEHRE
jgi:hypothetical protein